MRYWHGQMPNRDILTRLVLQRIWYLPTIFETRYLKIWQVSRKWGEWHLTFVSYLTECTRPLSYLVATEDIFKFHFTELTQWLKSVGSYWRYFCDICQLSCWPLKVMHRGYINRNCTGLQHTSTYNCDTMDASVSVISPASSEPSWNESTSWNVVAWLSRHGSYTTKLSWSISTSIYN